MLGRAKSYTSNAILSELRVLSLGMRFLAACAVQCAIAAASSASSKPRIFVYDFPDSIVDGTPTVDDRKCFKLASDSPDLLDCIFGAEFTVKTELGPLTLRKTDQYAMGRIFLWRLMGSANRVEDPREADLFFVPFWFSDSFPMPDTCPTAIEMFSQLHHCNPNTVRKHIFVSPRVAHDGDVCPFWWGHPWGRGLPKNQILYNASLQEKLAAGHMNAIMKFALEDRDCCWWVVGENTHSIPYPGFGSGMELAMTQKLEKLREPSRKRPVLVMGAFGIHGDPKEHSKSLRTSLSTECKTYGPKICSGVILKVVQAPGHALGLSDETFTGLVTAMLESRFCFQPTGDTPSRKGIVDSILLGCIPVLFSANQTRLWRWNLPDLASISVVLDVTKGDFIQQLQAIDEHVVTQLRHRLAQAAKSLAYEQEEGTGDAVEAALYHAWIHSGGKPTKQKSTPPPEVQLQPSRLYTTQAIPKEHHGVLALAPTVAEKKPPKLGPWWSDGSMGVAVVLCSIVIGVGTGFMVLRPCSKSYAPERFEAEASARRSGNDDKKGLLENL